MKQATIISLALWAAAQIVGVSAGTRTVNLIAKRQKFDPKPSTRPVIDQTTSQGCFTSQGNLTEVDKGVGGNSIGACEPVCKKAEYLVMALHGDTCYCGNAYPEKDSRVSSSMCDLPCSQYEFEPCGNTENEGGIDAWNVYNLGFETDSVPFYKKEEKETSSSAEPAATTTAAKSSAADGNPAAATSSESDPEGGDEDKKDGPNVAAIAAGVVVGVVIIAAAIGGAFFYVRRKRNAEIEEEHRRNAAVNAFISGAKPPGSSAGSISITDSRLEPGFAQRRLSDGSIADNQDYSRKILRVTNA